MLISYKRIWLVYAMYVPFFWVHEYVFLVLVASDSKIGDYIGNHLSYVI